MPAHAITRGTPADGITLRVEDGLLTVRVVGDPPAGALVECFREALETGTLTRSMPTLVDLHQFSGRVDWSSILQISRLVPWAKDPTHSSSVAYLSDSPWFGAVLKVTAELYPRSRHRRFDDEAAAIHWLRAARA